MPQPDFPLPVGNTSAMPCRRPYAVASLSRDALAGAFDKVYHACGSWSTVRMTSKRTTGPTRPSSPLVCTQASKTRTTFGPWLPAARSIRCQGDAY
jgi:hypothetical protein